MNDEQMIDRQRKFPVGLFFVYRHTSQVELWLRRSVRQYIIVQLWRRKMHINIFTKII